MSFGCAAALPDGALATGGSDRVAAVRRQISSLTGLSLVVALTALAGCGGSSSRNGLASKSPAEIIAAARTAADGASTVHVSGSTVTGGTPLTFDLSLTAGKGGRGRITEKGLSFELIELEGTIYIKGSSAFYKHFAGTAAAQLLQGKWLKASATNPGFAGLSSLTDLHKLLDAAFAAGDRSLVSIGTSTVDGQAVVGVKDTAQNETLYVATTGKPYPVAVTKGDATEAGGHSPSTSIPHSSSASASGRISFGAWDEPVTLVAPANAVDTEQLQRSQ